MMNLSEKLCFFCDKPQAPNETFHKASTTGLTSHVREAALELRDTKLLARLALPDMVALEAEYHLACLTDLYDRKRALKEKTQEDSMTQCIHGVVLAELVAYIEETKLQESVLPVFKLADLSRLYTKRMEEQDVKVEGRVHSTRLKQRILSQIPDMQAVKEGREVLLVFNKDVGVVLRQVCESNYDSDALHLSKAAQIVRRDMLKPQKAFEGSFTANCQEINGKHDFGRTQYKPSNR